jgi:hypothetical protein
MRNCGEKKLDKSMIEIIYTKLKFRSQTQLSPASCLMAPQTLSWIGSRHVELVSGSGSRISGSKGDEEKETLKKFQHDREMVRFLAISHESELPWEISLQRGGSERSFDFPRRLQALPAFCFSRHPPPSSPFLRFLSFL